MVTVDYNILHQVTGWLQWVTAGYSRSPSGYSWFLQITAYNRVVTVGYIRLQQVTEWLQFVTVGYSKLPNGYSGLQQVTSG